MAIKAGQILHDAEGFVIDRIQSAGPGNINIPEEKIYELGNFESVATVRDTPDLSFDLESFDVSNEFEAILVGQDPTALNDGDEIDLNDQQAIDIISPFKSGEGAFDIVRGIVLPYLNMERATYRFGVGQNATQQFTLRGDSIVYTQGTPYFQTWTNTGNDTYYFDNTALVYTESGDDYFAYSVKLRNTTTGAVKRLFLTQDYTNYDGGFTLLEDLSGTYDQVEATFASTTSANYPQSVHQGESVKPAAVRAKDIDVYLGTDASTPTFSRVTGVQNFEVTRQVTLDADQEFGNSKNVAQDFDTPDVSGTIGIKAVDPEDLWDKIKNFANVTGSESIGPFTSVALPVELRVADPDTGDVLKTLYVPDARFQVPPVQGRVQTKLEVTFNFSSDGGTLKVYEGER